MKILLITDLYPVDEFDINTPLTLYAFVKEWVKLGHDVKIIRPNFILNSFVRNKKFYKSGWYGNLFNVNYFFPYWFNIKNKLRDYYDISFEPDVIISHMPSGTIFANKLGVEFSACIHASDIQVLTNPLYSFYFKYQLENSLKSANKLFCRSYALKNKLKSLNYDFIDDVYLALSGVDKNFIVDIRNNIDTSTLKICTCANLIKRKNIDKLISAVKYFSNVQLTVIGDGNELSKLKMMSDKIIFTGWLTHDDVLKVMKENDIFILPSVNETFGMVYLEAMASGCVPVCTANDGIDGIIKNNFNGFTVLPTADSIRNLIQHIINSDAELLNYIRKNALDTVKQYTIEKCAKDYLELLIK